MNKPKFLFGDIVVINNNQIGIILKTWDKNMSGRFQYDVYNRMSNIIGEYKEEDIERYRVRHKYLNEEELYYQDQ